MSKTIWFPHYETLCVVEARSCNYSPLAISTVMVSAPASRYRYTDTLKGCVVPGGGFLLDDILGNWWCGGGVRDMSWTEGTGKRCAISTWLFFFISLYIWKFKSCNFNFRLQVTHRKYAKGDHLWWINIPKFIQGFFFFLLSRDIASQAEKMRERDDILKTYRKKQTSGKRGKRHTPSYLSIQANFRKQGNAECPLLSLQKVSPDTKTQTYFCL